ncbi:MAG: signal peptidase I [Actinobacteria bacterium]|nr:signal peptidase I [Actinomycetota bacterium]
MSLTSADETPPGASDRRRLSRPVRTAAEWVAIVAAALIAALLVKTFLFQPFYIPSESMVPTLRINDRVLVNKLDRDPERGRIFVFKRPSATTATPMNKDLIKRVIGEPGDKVEGREGEVFVNDRPLPEPYLPEGTTTSSFGPVTLTAGQVWVMGDNRGASMDSRTFGPIEKDSIVGRAFVLFWPPGEFKTL